MTDPRIAPGFRLQFEPAQDAWVLLYPEGMVKLNQPAAEILRRCDGNTSFEQITTELERRFREADLRADVAEFLADARSRGWIA
jgi:pyrroloquinoline quinone biosynthesis protein D